MRTTRRHELPTLVSGCLGLLVGLAHEAAAKPAAPSAVPAVQARSSSAKPASQAANAATTPPRTPSPAASKAVPAPQTATVAPRTPGAASAAPTTAGPAVRPAPPTSPVADPAPPAPAEAATAPGTAGQSAASDGTNATIATPERPTADSAAQAPVVARPRALPRLLHQPVTSVAVGAALALSAQWQEGAQPPMELFLHYRRFGQTVYETVRFGMRDMSTLLALIPEAAMRPGTLEYYISSRSGASDPEQLHFASPDWPHAVTVQIDDAERRLREMLAQHRGNRSQFRFHGLYVDRGQRDVISSDALNHRPMRDYYYRLEGDFTYRILSAVYSIRIGGGVVRGDSFTLQTPLPVHLDNVGLTYGFAEVRFRFGRLVRMDLRATLGAGPQHFDGGGGGQLLIGRDPGTHFAVGVDGVSSVGIRAWLRLAWDTVPRVPMSFALETSNLPLGEDMGGLMYLTLGYRFNRYFSFDANLGYAHRDKEVGGPIIGLAPKLEF